MGEAKLRGTINDRIDQALIAGRVKRERTLMFARPINWIHALDEMAIGASKSGRMFIYHGPTRLHARDRHGRKLHQLINPKKES